MHRIPATVLAFVFALTAGCKMKNSGSEFLEASANSCVDAVKKYMQEDMGISQSYGKHEYLEEQEELGIDMSYRHNIHQVTYADPQHRWLVYSHEHKGQCTVTRAIRIESDGQRIPGRNLTAIEPDASLSRQGDCKYVAKAFIKRNKRISGGKVSPVSLEDDYRGYMIAIASHTTTAGEPIDAAAWFVFTYDNPEKSACEFLGSARGL